jgi:mono/diheme cytochrome c family protein/glucose/arabinose dehydrogenase
MMWWRFWGEREQRQSAAKEGARYHGLALQSVTMDLLAGVPRGIFSLGLKLALMTAVVAPLAAQNGDQAGEVQPMLDRQWWVPPAPALSPEEAAARFQLPPGYLIEAVATEPLVQDPVDVAWDAQGRLWVVEMNQLMLNADAADELEPNCNIVILSDEDGDGIFDKRKVFLDKLVLPRSICFVPGGVVAILPPQMVFLVDRDGDDVVDHREVLAEGFTAGLNNPEHAPNSLVLGMDNWLYVANHGRRYRQVMGDWVSEPSARGGQWGQSQDDWGRLAFNYNSSAVHVNVLPPAAAVRNPALGRSPGVNVSTSSDRRVFPSRINPGVNRGYRKETLREDGRLASLTGACGPTWFTGTGLAEEDRGRLFSCEPCANVVQRFDVHESEGNIKSTLILEDGDPKLDFLTSTDERFRPVNLRVGPDGALYVVDLYRGILQHKVFMTSFLRRQTEERGLGEPTGLGRIWRIRHVNGEVAGPSNLVNLSDDKLRMALGHPNGWHRRTAQRLLAERGWTNQQNIEDLIQQASTIPSDLDSELPWLRMTHSLWAMESLEVPRKDEIEMQLTDPQVLLKHLASDGPSAMKQHVLRILERFMQEPTYDGQPILEQLTQIPSAGSAPYRWQLALTLGTSKRPEAVPALLNLLREDPQDKRLRDCILVGLVDREDDAIAYLLSQSPDHYWQQNRPSTRDLIQELSRCIMRRHHEPDVVRLLQWATQMAPQWQGQAMLKGALSGLPSRLPDKNYQFQSAQPNGLVQLTKRVTDGEDLGLTHPEVLRLTTGMVWNGEPLPKIDQADLVAVAKRGRQLYMQSCAACHQENGRGLRGLAPPLAGSEWLDLEDERLAEISLFGISGPIEVAGEPYDLSMPGWSSYSDEELAAILTFLKEEWSSEPKLIPAGTVAAVRAQGPPQ